MPSLLTLAVAFAGIGGPGASKVDTQVRNLLAAESEVTDADVTKAEKKDLLAHDEASAEIVQRLDVTGLVIGQLKKTKKGTTLTVVVYGHDGAMVDLIEMPVGAKKKKVKKLAAADLESLQDTVAPDVQTLIAAEDDRKAAQKKHDREVADAEAARDAEAEAAEAAETESVQAHASPGVARRKTPKLRIHVGVGARGRTFVPQPMDLRGYRSTPVPAARLALEVTPIKYFGIDAEAERTLTMNSDLDGVQTPSSIMHWQATGALRLPLGSVELAAVGGVGGRDFQMETDAPPTPNGHYLFAVAGARIGFKVGKRVEIRAGGAYEPVIGGSEQDTMADLGPSQRSAIEIGGGVIVDATSHIYVAGEASYQRFTWTWDAGTATDEYPSGTLSLGASY